uniref:Probable RNA-binding protein 18 n=1 Tax=Oryctolagus cuniculus TaxID=9986 RepID=A0A5F9CMB4_RABIT
MAEQFIVACHMLPNKLKMGIDLMEAETKTLPLENASILSEGSLQEGHRLWIGNLDPKITEYHLLKLLQRFGKVKQFDFLFHKSGALEGQPRGYCFVNFETKQEAEQAIQCLNGKLALSKKLVVRWAHAQVKVRLRSRRGEVRSHPVWIYERHLSTARVQPRPFTSVSGLLVIFTHIYYVCCQIFFFFFFFFFVLKSTSGGIKFRRCFSPRAHRSCF